jgi:phosphate transport system substrate-binding protein
MKRKIILALSLLVLSGVSSFAQKAENGKVIITGSRFVYPLLDKWIAEFKKQYPEVPFQVIARGGPNVDSANLIINAHVLNPEEIRKGYKVVNISQYTLLPVVNAKSPGLKDWASNGIKEKQFKTLFFKKVDPFAPKKEEKKADPNVFKPVLYTRLEKACAPTTFARNFGFEQADILGKQIGGDDKHLIAAVEKDTNGLTYNNLGMIYDLTTRKVKKDLAVLPFDLNGNGKLDVDENFYATLDEVIERLEKKKYSEITTAYVNISYPGEIDETNKNTVLFLNWILENGQQYNHDFGFLNFEKEKLVQQKELLSFSLNK